MLVGVGMLLFIGKEHVVSKVLICCTKETIYIPSCALGGELQTNSCIALFFFSFLVILRMSHHSCSGIYVHIRPT